MGKALCFHSKGCKHNRNLVSNNAAVYCLFFPVSIFNTCPPLFRTSKHCNAALAVTWLSHSSQYIFCFGLDGKKPQYPQKRSFPSFTVTPNCFWKNIQLCLRQWRLRSTLLWQKNGWGAQASSPSHRLHCGVRRLYTQQSESERETQRHLQPNYLPM